MTNRKQSLLVVPFQRIRHVLASFSRYDLALAAIPIAFLVGTVTHMVSAISLQGAFFLSAAIALFVLADVLFVNPPRVSPPS